MIDKQERERLCPDCGGDNGGCLKCLCPAHQGLLNALEEVERVNAGHEAHFRCDCGTPAKLWCPVCDKGKPCEYCGDPTKRERADLELMRDTMDEANMMLGKWMDLERAIKAIRYDTVTGPLAGCLKRLQRRIDGEGK